MEYCYVCGKKLSDDGALGTVKRHKEHIIHNGIYGRLKSPDILCEKCGGSYCKNDAEFVELFSGFLELCYDFLNKKDHGTKKRKCLKAYFNPDTEDKKEVQYLARKVFPYQPYYEVDEEKKEVRIFARKSRLEHYEKVFLREHPEFSEFKRTLVDDISALGKIALFFSEGNPDFNTIFRDGMVKIATEFALANGVRREDLNESLEIHSDNSATLKSSSTPLVPYSISTASQMLFALVEDVINPNYPSHILRLYSEDNKLGRVLICYIELFSTFQFYVILNRNYAGPNIDVHYAQRILMKVDNDKTLTSIYDLSDSLSGIKEQMYYLFKNYLINKTLPIGYFDKETITKWISTSIEDEGLEQVLQEVFSYYDILHFAKNVVYHYDDASPHVGSACEKSYSHAKEDLDMVREYSTFKFHQLERFCFNIDKDKTTGEKDK